MLKYGFIVLLQLLLHLISFKCIQLSICNLVVCLAISSKLLEMYSVRQAQFLVWCGPLVAYGFLASYENLAENLWVNYDSFNSIKLEFSWPFL